MITKDEGASHWAVPSFGRQAPKPIAVVRHFSPSGIPTTVMHCYNEAQILNAVESGWWADGVHICPFPPRETPADDTLKGSRS